MLSTALISSVIVLALFLSGVIFKMGHHSARLEALELWKVNMRQDMHEISDKLEVISNQIRALTTILDERTERHKT